MKKILSVSLGAARDDYAVEAQVLGQQVQVSRVGVDGDWERALQLLRASDGQVAAIGLGGLWRPRDRRFQAAREAVRVSRFADGRRVRPLLARRALAALEAHLNKTGATLGGMKALLPLASSSAALADTLRAFGCAAIAADLLFTLGAPIPLRHAVADWLAAQLVAWLPDRGISGPRGQPERWSRLLKEAHLVAADRPERLAALPSGLEGKIGILEEGPEQSVWPSRGLRLLAVCGPRFGDRTVGPAAVEATLLSLIEKPAAEIEVADLEAAVARAPLRPQILLPGTR